MDVESVGNDSIAMPVVLNTERHVLSVGTVTGSGAIRFIVSRPSGPHRSQEMYTFRHSRRK